MPAVQFNTHERVVAGDNDNLEGTVLLFQLGNRDDLTDKALATAVMSWRRLPIQPSTQILLSIGGYDNDPRELWDIYEVRRYVQRFCEKTKAHRHPQVERESRNWLLLCGADPSVNAILYREPPV